MATLEAFGSAGIVRKLTAQISVWQHLGVDARLFLLRQSRSDVYPSMKATVFEFDGVLSRWIQGVRLTKAVLNWAPQAVVRRFELWSPGFEWLERKIPTVVAVQSEDLYETAKGPKSTHFFHLATRGRVLRAASGLTFTTHELADSANFARFRKVAKVISNGVELGRYSPMPLPSSSLPELVFVGSGDFPWSGMDLLQWMARRFPLWTFHLIGPLPRTIDLPNVYYHGFLTKEGMRPLFERACAGIGPLALHRIKMQEACPLKVREYLANGLPVILSFRDTDFPDPVPFLFQLPTAEGVEERHWRALEAFVKQARTYRVTREQLKGLDLVEKERERLAFIQSLSV